MTKLRVDVWSDFACPWCWVGKRHLEAAAADFPQALEIHWHAFELDPTAPRSLERDVDYVQRLADKYGTGRARAQEMIDSMVEIGRARGLEFRFDRVRPTNTFDAHRLMHAAGDADRAHALSERLFRGYMHEGADLGDRDKLVRLAADCGIDPDSARALLDEGRFASEVRDDEATAAELGVRGVPFFVFGRSHAVGGAQPPDVLAKVMHQALDAQGPVDEVDDADACGPDGCATDS